MEDEIVDQGLGLMPQENSQQDNQQVAPVVQEQTQQESINPAWNDLLGVIPQGLHGAVTSHLKTWDQNYQQGIQKVHSQYEPYKPFLDSGTDPEALNNAMLIMQNLEADPEKFAKALVEHYGLQLGGQGQELQQTQEELEEEVPFDITQHPAFQRLDQGFNLLAQQTLTQHEQAEMNAAEADLDAQMAVAKEANPNLDEGYVYQYMNAHECDVATAAAAYQQFADNLIQNYRPPGANAPRLMGGGGGLPSQAVPVAKMTGQQRRALMVQTLNNLNASGG